MSLLIIVDKDALADRVDTDMVGSLLDSPNQSPQPRCRGVRGRSQDSVLKKERLLAKTDRRV